MKIYITTPQITLPNQFMKLALTGWLQEHPEVTHAAFLRKGGCYHDDVLMRFLYQRGIERINWSYFFRDHPEYTEFTWDLIAMRWEQPDWVVILKGVEEDERLNYTEEIAKRFDFNVAVLSANDRIDLTKLAAPPEVFEAYGEMYEDSALQEV